MLKSAQAPLRSPSPTAKAAGEENPSGTPFSLRVITLVPAAIALNIVLGAMVQQVLKLPIYLDSIGTILTGVLAGPLAGALTGILTNLLWQYAPGIGGSTIGPFAITSGVIGLLAGLWGRLGVYRPRPVAASTAWLCAAAAAATVILIALPIANNPAYTDPNAGGYPPWVFTAAATIALLAAAGIAAFIIVRRDVAGLWVAGAGAVTGVVAAFVSAPVAAYVFGGVTGSSADLIVAALRQGGADVLSASLGQGLFSDPLDKLLTSFVVFLVLSGLSRRVVARFPHGERLLRDAPSSSPAPPANPPAP